jgi:hypothetical protein
MLARHDEQFAANLLRLLPELQWSRVMTDEPITLDFPGTRVLTLTTEVRDLQQRFTALEQRFTAVELRLTGIEARLGALEARFSGQEERMTSMLALLVRIDGHTGPR